MNTLMLKSMHAYILRKVGARTILIHIGNGDTVYTQTF